MLLFGLGELRVDWGNQGPDYGIDIEGKCLGPTTSKGLTKDGCKIFEHMLANQSITDVLCFVRTKLPEGKKTNK